MGKLITKVKVVLKQLWSLVSDYQWDADPYKIAGIVCLVMLCIFAFAAGKAPRISGMLVNGALAVVFGAAGVILFGHAQKNDKAQAAIVEAVAATGSVVKAIVPESTAEMVTTTSR